MFNIAEKRTALRGAVRRAVEPVLASFKVPGIAVAVAHDGEETEHLIIGTDAVQVPITRDSLFPVASVSKLATSLAVLRLVDAGSLGLDEPLASYLPEAAAAQEGVTLRTLLAHTSGLPEDLSSESAPYTYGLSWRILARACLNTHLERTPNMRVQYSNVGYGLLAIIVERHANQYFPDALKSLVLKPLGIEGYLGIEPVRSPIVLTDVRSANSGTPLEPYNSPFWRRLIYSGRSPHHR